MKRTLFLLYGTLSYLITLGTLTYLVGFSTTVFVPRHLDNGSPTPVLLAVLINVGLVTLFGVQHSVMARPAFKVKWTRIVSEPIERSTYILIASGMTLLMMWQWRPIDAVLWQIENTIVANLLYGIGVLGWGLVVYATFLIDHFDLFGMRQVVLYFRQIPYTPVKFKSPILYKLVRHPMQLGVLIGIWVTPIMTASHLLYAITLTVYILIGLYFEERDLIQQFGASYRDYRKTTPKLLPWPRPNHQPAPTPTEATQQHETL